ncbi:MAG: hypothetical protein ACOC95_07675 [Planctomycetota bacterium]
MFEILNIPPPVLPGGALGMLVGAVLGLAGLALALFGRGWAGRLAPAAGFGLLAAAGGAMVARRWNLDPTWPAVVLGLVATTAGLVLPTVAWAAGAGVALAAAAELALLHHLAPVEGPGGFDATGMAAGAYAAAALRTLGAWLAWIMRRTPLQVVGAGATVALAGVLVGVLAPKPTRIVGSSLLGAALVVGGVGLAVASVVGEIPLAGRYGPWLMAVSTGLVAVGGIAYQVYADRIARKAAKGKESDDKGRGRRSHGDVR